MDISNQALIKVKKWQENGISKYRISKELNAQWITVWRWLNGKSKPSVSFSKNILDTEIEK
jgi:orotate phosphoribosyltransferase-like protein